ncbi:Xylulose kinase [Listeria ivanovii subsp. londoniensis]|uniref:Gluconokinase n=2 Tax=Listeria ivanovii TaxID=1638 RepID=A0ABS1G2J5_LISIV|nr:gluconokinase [Listeria ivanovii]EFR95632.1 gluconokinase [Listeria ivanovii FSL F6-596]AIS61064.1 gluconate kinase [Listeria ivanovii subsp. londoniensis]MBK1961086.1 gluconokinase [Listeria ivanovii subsp. londoniensis]SDV99987.1 gluconokinase [Listeria ivanovii]VEH48428.1 Xylulose kinase [Listeria ivanovii subsp. londoniensis]
MTNSSYIMGVDIGTSSTKAVLFNEQGEVIHREASHYDLVTDETGKAEESPTEIFEAILTSIRHVMSKINKADLCGIAFSSAMHSLIAAKSNGELLTECITWADGRSSEALENVKRDNYLFQLYEATGTPIHPMSPFAKICWLKETEPELFNRAEKFIDIKSYILYRFFGVWVMDESLASGTGLYNISEHDWEFEAMEIVKLTPDFFPKVVPETHQLSGVKAEYAEMMGIPASVPFIIGGSDGALANIGIQATGQSDVTITVGTSGAVRKLTTEFQVDSRGRTFCYGAGDGYFIAGGAVNNGGKVVEWGLEQFGSESEIANRDFASFIACIDQVNPGAAGLLFQPYLLGERAPFWTNDIRGGFVGLTINHTKAHFVRAILEGIAFNLAEVYEAVSAPDDIIYVTGGISAHEDWCRLLADILNREIRVPHTIEGSSLGAAIIGMRSLGILKDLNLQRKLPIKAIYHPSENVEKYAELRSIFKQVSTQLMSSYSQLNSWQKKFENNS